MLVVAADVYSRILDFGDRRTAVLFGDGAGAAVVGAVPAPYGLVDVELVTRGDAHELIHVKAGGSRLPASAETVAAGDHFFRMNGRGVRDFVMTGVPPVLADLLKRAGVTAERRRPLRAAPGQRRDDRELVEEAGLPVPVPTWCWTATATPAARPRPIALDAAARAGELHNGELVLLAGFGGGMSVGAALLRWYDR